MWTANTANPISAQLHPLGSQICIAGTLQRTHTVRTSSDKATSSFLCKPNPSFSVELLIATFYNYSFSTIPVQKKVFLQHFWNTPINNILCKLQHISSSPKPSLSALPAVIHSSSCLGLLHSSCPRHPFTPALRWNLFSGSYVFLL